MGLNVYLVKVKATGKKYTGYTKEFQEYKEDMYDDFESRCTYDREFLKENEFTYLEDSERGYCRPSNFDSIKKWIQETHMGGQDRRRFIYAIKKMELDKNIYFDFDW